MIAPAPRTRLVRGGTYLFRDQPPILNQSHARRGRGGVDTENHHKQQSRQQASGNSGFESCLVTTAYRLFLAFEEPGDVVVESINHDQDQDKDADLLGPLPMLEFDGATKDPFQGKK